MTAIPREPAFDRPRFEAEFLRPGAPVVYAAYAAEWTAVKRWTPSELARRYGAVEVPLDGRDERSIRLAHFVELMTGEGAGGAHGERPYLRNIWLRKFFPDLVADLRIPEFVEPNRLAHPLLRPFIADVWAPWIELFLSAPRTRFPRVHADIHHTHAWLAQVHGTKRLWLWPPPAIATREDAEDLTVCPDDDLQRFFPGCEPSVVDLAPGDVLFVPCDWWHTAESLSPSVTLSGNFVRRENWHAFLMSYFIARSDLEETARHALLEVSRSIEADAAGQ